MNTKIFSLFTFLSFFIFQILSLNAQNTLFNSRLNIRLGSSLINSKMNEYYSEKSPMLYGSISYNFNEIIELGVYAGSGRMLHALDLHYNAVTGMDEWYSKDSTSFIRTSHGGQSYSSSKHIRYGLVSELHILPLFNIQKVRFDVYIQPQIGLITENYEVLNDYQEYIWSKPVVEYGLGIGLRYRLSKSFGFFVDYSYGKYYNQDKFKLKTGIAITI